MKRKTLTRNSKKKNLKMMVWKKIPLGRLRDITIHLCVFKALSYQAYLWKVGTACNNKSSEKIASKRSLSSSRAFYCSDFVSALTFLHHFTVFLSLVLLPNC